MKYLTIEKNSEAQIIEKKSKFIAKLYHVDSQEKAESILKKIKKEHYNAKHCCYAYRIINRNEAIIEKFSDDGEPSGTAGAPLLKILNSKKLCNVLIIVIRYFGGILLGTGGLVRVYTGAFQEVLNNVIVVEKQIQEIIEIQIEYPNIEKFKYYCQKNNIEIIKMEYEEKIKCIISIEKGLISKIKEIFL